MDIFDKCFRYTAAKEVIQTGYYPYFLPLTGNEGCEANYHGHKLIMCGSNNYLGLTTHPKVHQAALDAINHYGTSCTGSRFLNGTLEMHEQLENELADWVDKDAALVFSTGMQTNLGVISSIVCRGDVVVLDKDDHASIVDGARLSWGETRRFRHNDIDDLERILSNIPEEKGRMVIVDGLYSMGGDLAPLPEIIPICKKYHARVMVDDAHAMGVLGGGKGTAAHFGVTEDVDLIMSTFSKSFASLGGFIAGDKDVIHFIKHNARSLIFSASIPPSNTAAALAALEVMRSEPERISRVNQIADHMRKEYQTLGFNTLRSQSPIIPIVIGETMRTLIVWKALFEAGVFVNPVISPAVTAGSELLRTSYMATHTDEQLDKVLSIFEQIGKRMGLIS
jgi:8-amino-7-oxononanoate synthase